LLLLCEEFLKLKQTVDTGLVVQTSAWGKPDGMKRPRRARLQREKERLTTRQKWGTIFL